MSGRVAAVDVVASDPTVMFVGASTGGVWRSRDGGLSWTPVFDDQPILSVGALAVNQENPDIVWVGTGEGNPRNSMGVGYGVFRSMDGGDTWTHLGLEASERIHRIVLDPRDPDVAFVAAMGPAWSDGDERGVYRTLDGGETWERVLYASERTGAADLVMDPSNPNKLFAAMWEYRRWPWFFESGGPGSGLFVTHDGGDSWTEVTAEAGLPEGELGRIGLAVAPSDPRVVYALVEAERSELLRSADGGRTFETISDREGVANRPFYYADLRIDPENENRLYSLHGRIEVSEDQGRTFRTLVPSQIIHGDVQELWIHPHDPRFMIIGNDGGIGVSRDRGEHWRFVENLPLAQFYHVSVDDAVPFNVYGGLQDNGSWYGPSTVWETRGIINGHWRRVGGGDGFAVMTDRADPRFGYSMSQQGNLMRFDKVTGERRSIRPLHPDGERLRFNWNAALAQDPHEPSTIYLASQFVHRSRNGGASWEIISPDLTTNDPEKQRQDQSGGLTLDATGAENHTTIVSVSVSPRNAGLIWVGTDDGNIQVTRDGGATWTDVAPNLTGVPPTTWVPHVEPSHSDDAVAYAVLDDHRRGNWTPYVFRTDDHGATWTSLATDDVFGFTHVIREDPVEPDLLFLGTEFGLYVSVDGGASWIQWTDGLPPAPVRDLVIHPRDHDLVLGTHGRSVWVVDDIRPLRALAAEGSVSASPVTLFEPPPAYTHAVAEGLGYRSTGHAMFFGDARPYGALLSYWVGEGDPEARASVELREEGGMLISTIEGPATHGLHRVVWDLTMAGDSAESRGAAGVEVLPGSYAVSVQVGDARSEGMVQVMADPREPRTLADRTARLEARLAVASLSRVATEAQEHVNGAAEAVDAVLKTLRGDNGHGALVEQGEAVRDGLTEVREALFTGPSCQGICGGVTQMSLIQTAARTLGSSTAAPGDNDRIHVHRAEEATAEIVRQVNRVFAEHVDPYRQALAAAGFTSLPQAPVLALPSG
jgi:photosystem II stability/assembly factor-like uncharacterized protein